MLEVKAQVAPIAETPASTFSLWVFLKENFAVVSALAVLSGITLAIIFLFAYLSMFDWHLIEFVQYVDVITVGIMAVGVMSGSFGVAYGCIFYFVHLPKESKGYRQARLIVDGGIALVLIWSSVHVHQGYMHVVEGALLLAMLGGLTAGTIFLVRQKSWPTVGQALGVATLVFAMAGITGRWVASSVLEMPGSEQNVRGKDWNLDGVKIVIVMSRFTVLLKGENLYVVPTSDIVQFHKSRPLTTILSTPDASKTTPSSSARSSHTSHAAGPPSVPNAGPR